MRTDRVWQEEMRSVLSVGRWTALDDEQPWSELKAETMPLNNPGAIYTMSL